MVKNKSFKIIWDKQTLDNFKEILTFLSKQSSQAPKIVKKGILSRLDIIKTNALICELDKLKDNPNKGFPYGCQDDQCVLRYLNNKYFKKVSIL